MFLYLWACADNLYVCGFISKVYIFFKIITKLDGHCNDVVRLDDEKSIFLNQINGFDICDFKLPSKFENLNKMKKIEVIFENMENYKSKLDDAQLNLINKIIQLRRQNNIQNNILGLNYEYQQQLSDYIINKKTELIFDEEKNIYKFSNNYYLIKYSISECQRDIKEKIILNISTIDFLDKINIMLKYNYEYIALYKNQFNENDM